MRKLLFLVSVALLLLGQSSPQQQPPVFRTDVSLVRVDVQVLENNRLVPDLQKEDFHIYDEGAVQTIEHFGRESEPLSLLLLVDVSGSMMRYVEQMVRTASDALKFLQSGDEIAVMLFSRQTQIVQDFTPDRRYASRALQEATRGPELGSGTVINPSLLAAVDVVREQVKEPRRRAILILTDNQPLNYQSPDEPVIQQLLETGTVLDAIVVGRYGRPKPPPSGVALNPDFTPSDVFRIAEATGGEAVRDNRVDRVFPRMIERIRLRYSLQYKPPIAERGSYRHIRVELSTAARQRHPKAVLRAREGYYANSGS